MTGILLIIVSLLALALSWIVTCVIIKLITLCFGVAFSWLIATGIWLVFLLLKSYLNQYLGNKQIWLSLKRMKVIY